MRKALYILGQLNDTDVQWLIKYGKKLFISQDQVLIQEDKAIDALYFVLDGAFAIRPSNRAPSIPQLEAGEVLGEMSFIEAQSPTATVVAAKDSFVLAIPRERLSKKLTSDSAFAARFYKALAVFLSYRLRDTMGYGSVEIVSDDELDSAVMDTLYMAGMRFDRILEETLK